MIKNCGCKCACVCAAWTVAPDGTKLHWGTPIMPPSPAYRAILDRRCRIDSLDPRIAIALEENRRLNRATSTWDKPRAAARFGDTYYVMLDRETVVTVTQDEMRHIHDSRDEHMGHPLQVPSPLQFFVEGWIQHFIYGDLTPTDAECEERQRAFLVKHIELCERRLEEHRSRLIMLDRDRKAR